MQSLQSLLQAVLLNCRFLVSDAEQPLRRMRLCVQTGNKLMPHYCSLPCVMLCRLELCTHCSPVYVQYAVHGTIHGDAIQEEERIKAGDSEKKIWYQVHAGAAQTHSVLRICMDSYTRFGSVCCASAAHLLCLFRSHVHPRM